MNLSNLDFSDINKFKAPGTTIVFSSAPGLAITPVPDTSLNGFSGGVPLFKNGALVGGIGVVGDGTDTLQIVQRPDTDEDVALAGQIGFAPLSRLRGSKVFIDGIRVPYVLSRTRLDSVTPFVSLSNTTVAPYNLRAAPPPFNYPTATLGGVPGQVRQPIVDDPIGGLINGQQRLNAAEVADILGLAAARAAKTRAGIRLPRGRPAQVFITVVNNPDQPGVAPTVLGTFRTPDATIFSWDVAVQKARTAVFFSSDSRAYSTRTVGFLAQSRYPPGIRNTTPGIFFGMQERFSKVQGTNIANGAVITDPPSINPNLPNGITIFPGGFPLYRNGVLIGAIGVSGDGVDQDDIIAASGTVNYLPPRAIRADQMIYRDARLPYAKFPRNPVL